MKKILVLALTYSSLLMGLSNIQVLNVTSRQARFTWDTISLTGCGFIDLTTKSGDYSAAFLQTSWTPCQSVNNNTRGYVFSSLKPSTTYYYIIRQYVAGTSGAQEAGSPSIEASFTTLMDNSRLPIAPTLYQPTPPTTITGSTLTVNSCGTLQSTINTAGGLDINLVHKVVLASNLNCAAPITLPVKTLGTGWVIIQSDTVDTDSFPPRNTRAELNESVATISIYSSSTDNYQGLSVAGAPATGTNRWWIRGIRLKAATIETPLEATITSLVQGASSVCGTANNTWNLTTAIPHLQSNGGWIATIKGANFSSGTAPVIIRGYSTPTGTTATGCSFGLSAVGTYTANSGVLHVYGGLAVNSATSIAGISTIVTSSSHGLTSGMYVAIQNGVSGMNGSFQILSTPTPTSFTITSTHASYTNGAIISYGPGLPTALVELTETSRDIVFEQVILECNFPSRCLVPFSIAGGQNVNVRDNYISRFGWAMNPIVNDFLNQMIGTNSYEGGGVIEGTTAGPLTITNSTIVGTGINVFTQQGRSSLASPTGQLALLNNLIKMSPECITTSPLYQGLACPGRHLIEYKATQKSLIKGNEIGPMEKNTESVTASDVIFFGPRCNGTSSCNTSTNAIQDIRITSNLFRSVPSILGIAGGETVGYGQPPPTHHISLDNNVILDLNGYFTTVTPGNGGLVRFWNLDAMQVRNNTALGSTTNPNRGIWPSIFQNFYLAESRADYVGNILTMNNDNNRAGYTTDTSLVPVPALVTTMPGLIASQYLGGDINRNIIISGVETSNPASNCFGSSTAGCNYTVAEATSYFAGLLPGTFVAGTTANDRINAVVGLSDGRLSYTSPYAGYGATFSKIQKGLGYAQGISITKSSNNYILKWLAPNSNLCSIERSNDNFITKVRVLGSSIGINGLAQSGTFISVPSGTWTFRVACGQYATGGTLVI